MAALGSFLLLATFVVASYALAASVAGGRRRSHALIESGVGAFYTTAALMTVASAVIVHAFVTGNYAIKYVQRYSDAAQPLAYKITSVLGRPRRLDHVLGVPAVGVRRDCRRHQPRAPPRVDPLGRRHHLGGGDVLHLHHGGAQQPLQHVRGHDAGRRQGTEPAPPELLHGDPSAVALHRLRRDDDPVRVRHGGAHHRASRRRVAARRAALDDDRLAVPDASA